MTTPVIQFDDVSKRFTLHHDRAKSFQEAFVNIFRRRESSELFWALQNVSFEIGSGESVGIIGENGSGKSTTLKLITRILEPTSGKLAVTGRISALLELGAGFHPDLTGKENVYLNGSLLGYSRREMNRKYDEIIEFSELDRFIDTPIKHYSSGMHMRLGFAIAISSDPDILITDEVLAVGDESFQRKCLDKIWELRKRGKTILFVSHSLGTVRDLCTRAIWLERGKVKLDGPARGVVDTYLSRQLAKYQATLDIEDVPGVEIEHNRWGTREIEIDDVEFLDRAGEVRPLFRTGEPLIARIWYNAKERIDRPVIGVGIHRNDGAHVCGPNTVTQDAEIPFLEGRGYVDFVTDELPLLDGIYEFTAAIYDHEQVHPYDHHERRYSFHVWRGDAAQRYGIVNYPCRFDLSGIGSGVQRDARTAAIR